MVISTLNQKAEELKVLCDTNLSNAVKCSEIKNDEVIVELHEGVHKQDMLRMLLDHDMDIEKFMIYEPSLTDIFVAKAGDEA